MKATGGSETVTVTVTDEDEGGKVSFGGEGRYQPQVGRTLNASVSDPDKPVSDERWQWSRGPSSDGPWTDIDKAASAARAPVAADEGMYLRATVTYTDKFDSGKTESGVTDVSVETQTVSNERPSFAAQERDSATGIQVSRTVDENAAVGTGIGKPVTATEATDGDVLVYTLDWTNDLREGDGAATSDTGDARFTIDRSSGQIKVGKKLNFEALEAAAENDEETELGADSIGGAVAVATTDTGAAVNDEMYILRVRATDPSGAYANVNVIVSLKDINEAPAFDEDAPKDTVTVVERGSDLLQPDDGDATDTNSDPDPLAGDAFLARDQDVRDTGAEDDDTIAAYAVEGADKKLFSITPPVDGVGGGVLTIVGTHTPDYEKKDSYSITITVTGGEGGRRLIGSIDVTIKVTDAEDPGKVALTQRGPQEGRVVVATLSDQDDGETITGWQWQYVERTGTEVLCNPGAGETPLAGTWADIPNATSAAYTPKDFTPAGEAEVDIVGKCLRATATYTDDFETPDDETSTEMDESIDMATAVADGAVQAPNAANAAPNFPDQDPNTTGDQSDTAMREVAENTAASMSKERQ